MSFFLSFLAGYLLGSIPFSYLLGKLRGVDLRKVGSGNIGATNLARICGKPFGILGFLLDAGKGVGGVLIGGLIASLFGGEEVLLKIFGGIGSIAGHIWTFILKFKGGKGVATSAGVFFGLAPLPLILSAGVWGFTFFLTGYVSLASILSSISLPLFMWVFHMHSTLIFLAIIISLLIIYRHRSNIQRLLKGKENRFPPLWKKLRF